MEYAILAVEAAIAIATGYILYRIQRRQDRRDDKDMEREDAIKKRDLLSLKMQMASAKLSFAVAMAVKRGTPNGEIEEGIAAYEEAKKEYMDFLNEQAAEHLMH